MTAGFQTEMDVRLAGDFWVHLSDLVWEGSDGDRIVVPAGRETDFATVPRLLQVFLPSADPTVVRAAAIHDELCRRVNEFYAAAVSHFDVEGVSRRKVRQRARELMTNPANDRLYDFRRQVWVDRPDFTSADADGVFRKIMVDEGAGPFLGDFAWLGVRLGALANPARRIGWAATAGDVVRMASIFLLLVLVPALLVLALVLT